MVILMVLLRKRRVHEVLALSNECENKFYNSKIGKVYDGVVEIHDNGLSSSTYF